MSLLGLVFLLNLNILYEQQSPPLATTNRFLGWVECYYVFIILPRL